MDLNDFYGQIDDLAGEAGVVDTQIPVVVRHAALWLERNYNFAWMRTERTATIVVGDVQTHQLDQYVKSFIGGELREFESLEGIQHLRFTRDRYAKLDDEEFEGKFPVYYSKNPKGQAFIRPLIESFAVSYDMAYSTIDRTASWPQDVPGAVGYTHPLIDVGEDVLTARSMLNLSAVTRDPELREFYGEQLQTGIKTLLDDDFQLDLSD